MEPSARLTAEDCLDHPIFESVRHLYPDIKARRDEVVGEEDTAAAAAAAAATASSSGSRGPSAVGAGHGRRLSETKESKMETRGTHAAVRGRKRHDHHNHSASTTTTRHHTHAFGSGLVLLLVLVRGRRRRRRWWW